MNRKGFTLVELIAVITIMSLIAIITTPAYDSISKSINILINILGTIVVYSVIINLIPFSNLYLKLFSNILFELSNALNFNSMFFNNSLIVSGIIFSFGGLSIFTQIKSILKDTFIDFNLLIKSRLICTCICVIICWFT